VSQKGVPEADCTIEGYAEKLALQNGGLDDTGHFLLRYVTNAMPAGDAAAFPALRECDDSCIEPGADGDVLADGRR
jgi:hypothetical protein